MSGSNDYQQTAWLKTNYNTGGDTYEIGVKKLYLSDVVAPIGTITYSPDNTTPTNGDVIVQMETSEPIETPAGWTKVDDTHYTLTMSDNGTGSLEIVDNSGNTGSIAYDVGNIDKTPPTATFTYSETAPTNQDVTVTMTTSEPIDTPAGWTRVDDTHFTKVVPLNENETVSITDVAGNTSDVSYDVANIDKVAPVVSINTPPAITGSNKDNYTIAGTCTPGDLDVEVSVNGIPQINRSIACSPSGTYTLTLDLSALPEGDTTVEVTQRDLAGNVSDTVTATLYKDTLPPDITNGGTG